MSDQSVAARAITQLDDARQRLYRVFGRVPAPERIDGCPHCVDPGAERCLLEGPIGSISAATLASYAFKALTTWGDIGDLRYFLPRLLDLAASGVSDFPAPEIGLGKLAPADWRLWEADEVAAVESFLAAWWHSTLHTTGPRPGADTVLCSVAATGVDLAAYLRVWGRLETEESVRQLHHLVLEEIRWTPGVRMSNPFWCRDSHHLLVGWLTGGPAAAAVEAAFDRETREPVLELLAAVHPWLRPDGGSGRVRASVTR